MKTHKHLLFRIGVLLLFAVVTSLPSYGAPLNIGSVPLYLTARADPNVLLNMSVETPMGGAAYNDEAETGSSLSQCDGREFDVLGDSSADNIGTCYVDTRTYLGYFDPNKCYTYDTGNSRFNPAGATGTNHTCTSQWSGNFLNWATMTAVDMFIWTMTGGNRTTDTTSLTVVRRSRKQNSNSWFPRKVLNSTINVAPSTVTPYSDTTLFIHNTDWGFQLGTTFSAATGSSPTYGPFNVDLKVCDSAVGLETNCIAYGTSPSIYYKPEGMIQRNASSKRFAVMAYTNDNSQSRWGGVLRAPMKYVGPTMPDGSGGTVSNSSREWDTNGILRTNPDNATSWSQSGVINYVNKFSEPGYKSYDPIGELFYEAIRYFKNLGPTPEAYSGITPLDSTNSATGGFPIYTTWKDPIQYHCQKNFIVAINDANPWLDKQLPGTFFQGTNVQTCTADATKTCIVGASSTEYPLTANDFGEPSNPDPDINVTTLTNLVGQFEGLNSTGVWTNTGTWTSGAQSGTNDSVGGGVGTFDNSCNDKTSLAMNLGEVMGTCGGSLSSPSKQNSYYIAGLAYYANTTDLRPDLSYPSGQTNLPQSVSSFFIDTQEFATNRLDGPHNMLWLAGKYGGFRERNNSNPKQPDQAAEWDADSNGLPDNYVLATKPQKLVEGLNAAFIDIENRTSTAAAVALNSSTISTETRVFQAEFNTAYWSGDLIAWPIDTATGAVQTTPSWRASNSGNVPAWGSRKIVTRRGNFGTGYGGVAFRWPSDPTSPTSTEINASQVANLKSGGVSDTIGQLRLQYLRGETTYEAQYNPAPPNPVFRDRFGYRLGDFINSAPVHVGKPQFLPNGLAEASPHTTFRAAVANRTPVVYIGSNDGMVHGFNANTGAEVLAYVPYAVFPELYRLTATNYSHRYYVDGQVTYGDAYGAFANCGSGSCWRTILVGSLGGGGKGIYALDITDPSTFTETNANKIALWELTSDGNDPSVTTDDDADLGYTYGQPIIARMKDGSWRAIFGNGYNSASEKAVLYLVDIVNPGGTNGKIKITLDNTAGGGNGLSGPAVVDVNSDYIADYIFAGDLKGNLWKVDVTATNSDNWGSAYKSGSTPIAMFKATTTPTGSTSQSITVRPEVSGHPVSGNGGFMVYFGTGMYLQDSDKNNADTQTFYGVWDKNTSSATQIVGDRLKIQTIGTASTPGGITVRTVTDNQINNWGSSGSTCNTSNGVCMGWRVDQPETGERVVTDPLLLPTSTGARILYTTLVPDNTPCSYGGSSWVMEHNPLNGGPLTGPIFDVNSDGVFDSSDLAGGTTTPAGIQHTGGILSTGRVLHGGTASPPGLMNKYFGSTDGQVAVKKNSGGLNPRRQSWRQLK